MISKFGQKSYRCFNPHGEEFWSTTSSSTNSQSLLLIPRNASHLLSALRVSHLPIQQGVKFRGHYMQHAELKVNVPLRLSTQQRHRWDRIFRHYFRCFPQ